MGAHSVPLCARCGEELRRDEAGLIVHQQVPGWACVSCVTVLDLTKLNLC